MCAKHWLDDPLTLDQDKWCMIIMKSLLGLKSVKFPRSLWPEGRVGLPIFVIFSDGAVLAYGAVAYICWELKEGDFGHIPSCQTAKLLQNKDFGSKDRVEWMSHRNLYQEFSSQENNL